ncbi:MAG TPA: ABC transporter substrate-binding protein [Nevskiaceae bacterium]
MTRCSHLSVCARRLGIGIMAASALAAGSFAGAASAAPLTPMNIAMVTSMDTEPYMYAKQQGYYKDVGLDVTLSTTDSGPAIATGVINGTYDAAAAAAFPILIAISRGAPLRIMPGVTTVGPGVGNSGLVVKADSPIKNYKDLVGKTVATNALTSLTTLATKLGVKQEGGNPDGIHFVSLPFKSSLQAVARGQAAAAVVISPFETEAEINGMKVISDPIGTMMPKGSPYNIMFTSVKNAKSKAKEFAAFHEATARAVKELKADPALQRKLAVSLMGMSKKVAEKTLLPAYDAGPINLPQFQKYADDIAEFGYTKAPVHVADVVINP